MTATTYVDLVSEQYPESWLCSRCSVVVRYRDAHWYDGSQSAWCWQGLVEHAGVPLLKPAPVISPSPLLAWRRDSI